MIINYGLELEAGTNGETCTAFTGAVSITLATLFTMISGQNTVNGYLFRIKPCIYWSLYETNSNCRKLSHSFMRWHIDIRWDIGVEDWFEVHEGLIFVNGLVFLKYIPGVLI